MVVSAVQCTNFLNATRLPLNSRKEKIAVGSYLVVSYWSPLEQRMLSKYGGVLATGWRAARRIRVQRMILRILNRAIQKLRPIFFENVQTSLYPYYSSVSF